MSKIAETRQQVVTYTPPPAAPEERDLIMLEQEEWGPYCGLLTRGWLARYLLDWFFGEDKPDDEREAGNHVNCCGYGGPLAIPIYVYEIGEGVSYGLRTTVGQLGDGIFETVNEREAVSFALEKTANIRHPAARIVASRWQAGPWTTGGADVAAPALSVSGREVIAPIPLFGTVELLLEVRRWRHILTIPEDEAEALLIAGWAEFVVGLPPGGRPVGLEITPPPGAEELAKGGYACGRGKGGDSGHVEDPEEDEPTAQPEDKIVNCEYCELECDDPDDEGGE